MTVQERRRRSALARLVSQRGLLRGNLLERRLLEERSQLYVEKLRHARPAVACTWPAKPLPSCTRAPPGRRRSPLVQPRV